MLNIYHSAADAPEVVPRNSIIHADCFDVFDKIATASVDCILCDLPYGTTDCKWDTVLPFDKLWAAYKRIAKPRAPIILFGSQPFTSALVMSNPKMFRFEWIWDKVSGANFANAKNQPLKVHENILVFSQEPIQRDGFHPIREWRSDSSLQRDPIGSERKKTNNKTIGEAVSLYSGSSIKATDKPYLYSADGKKHPTSIKRFSRTANGVLEYKHPTKKPIGLLEYLIKTYTKEGDLVLDNCLGSGSTFVACVQTNRDCIGIEKFPIDKSDPDEPQYFYSHCIPRIEEAIREKANPTQPKAKKKSAPSAAQPEQKPDNNPQLGLF